MNTIYDKIDIALKEIRRIQRLIKQGLAMPSEKADAFSVAQSIVKLFTDEIFKRKAIKVSKETIWSKKTLDGFVSPGEASQLDGWISLLEEYKDKRKVKSELSSETMHIKSVVDGEDQHIFVTEKDSGDHVHLILDGGTGEIRIDPKDKSPHEMVKSIEAKLKFKTGEIVNVTRSSINFVEPEGSRADVKAYTTTKDGYFVLEVYNNGDEDLEDIVVQAHWIQPEGPQERILKEFNSESDYLVMAMPKSLNMLKKGERVYSHIPSISVDKKIKIIITCKGMKDGKLINKEFELETQSQYK